MKKYILVLFLFPFFVLADGTTVEFCATGFGTANVDGTYTYVDSAGGNYYSQMPERYENGLGYFIYTIAGSSSMLLDSTIGDASPNYYYKNFVDAQNGDYTEIAGTWNIENLGASPAGTIVDCTPEPPAPPINPYTYPVPTYDLTTGSATSSLEQTQQNLFNSFILFWLTFVFIIWFFRKRSI